ncbi:MAG TPA: hypothetical protein VFM46_07500, partial [Pseudomonadales bacterium]|nr:hypothetical protein [Pseudomonadales bacterium]
MRKFKFTFCCLLLCAAPVTWAQDKWVLNGFLSQYGIYTSDNFMLGPSDDNFSLDYREAAAIVHGGVSDSINFSAQILSRKAGVSEDGSPKIDYGFFSWRLYDSPDAMHSLTAGRVKVPIGFFNDLRESPFTRNGVLVPQSAYPDRVRNSMMSADELLLTNEFRFENWNLNLATGAGSSLADKEEAVDNFDVPINDYDLSIDRAKRWNIRMLAEYQEGKLRLAYSRYSVPARYHAVFHPLPDINLPLNGEVKGVWDLISLEYNTEAFSLTGEFFRAIVTFSGVHIDPSNPDYRNVPQGGYLQFTYHQNPQWDFFLRYDSSVFDNEDANGKYYSTLLRNVPHYGRYTTDHAVGVAYRPTPDWLL